MMWREALRLRGPRPRRIAESLGRIVVHNAGLKLVSLLVAFGLWFFVNAGERDTEVALPLPLELRNIPANVMIVSPRVDFVDLRVSGPRALLSRIDPDQLAMPLDLGGVRPGPAVFRIRADSLNLPRGVNIVRITPAEVTVEFAQVARKTVPVQLTFGKKPPGDLRVTDVKVAPESVEIIGPVDEVEEVKVAETVPIDLSAATPGIIEQDVDLEIPREYLSFTAAKVHARVRLEEPEQSRVIRGVLVVVRNSPYRYALTPEAVQITIRGPQSSVESLELVNGAVYIDATDHEPGNYQLTPAIDLPADVELVKQQPEVVRLEVFDEARRIDAE